MTPLLTLEIHQTLLAAQQAGSGVVQCSLDLGCSTAEVTPDTTTWRWQDQNYPYLEKCKERTVYYWDGKAFEPVARFSGSLIKLVPTEWGAPTFEIDGIKMLPTAQVSPFDDARHKVELIQPQGKVILDCCGGLGYFANWCLQLGAKQIHSFEKNADVIWLRSLNPWSPSEDQRLRLTHGSVVDHIGQLADASVDAILHDPPRFGIAGELYSQDFYTELARVIKRKGRLFHYTGSPNKLTSGRDVPREVAKRLQQAGFTTELSGDGVLAIKR